MIFAQSARKEWEQVVNTSDLRRAAAWQRRSSKATIVILRTGQPGTRANEAPGRNVARSRIVLDRVRWTLTRVVRHHNVQGVYVVRI